MMSGRGRSDASIKVINHVKSNIKQDFFLAPCQEYCLAQVLLMLPLEADISKKKCSLLQPLAVHGVIDTPVHQC